MSFLSGVQVGDRMKRVQTISLSADTDAAGSSDPEAVDGAGSKAAALVNSPVKPARQSQLVCCLMRSLIPLRCDYTPLCKL